MVSLRTTGAQVHQLRSLVSADRTQKTCSVRKTDDLSLNFQKIKTFQKTLKFETFSQKLTSQRIQKSEIYKF